MSQSAMHEEQERRLRASRPERKETAPALDARAQSGRVAQSRELRAVDRKTLGDLFADDAELTAGRPAAERQVEAEAAGPESERLESDDTKKRSPLLETETAEAGAAETETLDQNQIEQQVQQLVKQEEERIKQQQAAQEQQNAGGAGPGAAGGGAPGGAGGGGAAPGGAGGGTPATLHTAGNFFAQIDLQAELGRLVSGPGLRAGTNSWAKPGGFPNTLGLVTPQNTFGVPKFDFDVKQQQKVVAPTPGSTPAPGTTPAPGGGTTTSPAPTGGGTAPQLEFVAAVRPTAATDAVHPCVSSPAGDHDIGTQAVPVSDGKTTKMETYKKILRISPSFASRIWAAEDEHLADLLYAYQISIEKAATEVNNLAKSGPWTGPTEADAKKQPTDKLAAALPAKLSANAATWGAVVWSLVWLSAYRDQQGWHSFGTTAGTVDHGKKEIVIELTNGTTQVGTHSTPSVISYARLP